MIFTELGRQHWRQIQSAEALNFPLMTSLRFQVNIN